METICRGKEPIATLWNVSPIQQGRYRLMRYQIRTDYKEGALLLNVVTGELVWLNPKEVVLIESLPKDYVPEMDELIAHRFLVPETFDELTSTVQLRRLVRSLSYHQGEIVGYTILPTTTCNARCFYCYESDYPRCNMSDETIDELIDYIEAHCGESKKVLLRWFGGEPTIGEKCIDSICKQLRMRDIQYSSNMISNGYLFTEQMVKKAKKDWRLRSIQITLDGTEEVYNRVKAYVYTTGNPYQRVISNIRLLLEEKIRVSIRMNLDRHNAENLKELIDELAENFLDNKFFSVYVHEIFDGMGYEPIERSDDELQQIIEKLLEIETYIDRKGFSRPATKSITAIPSLRITYCMADNPSTLLVNPQGMLGKCQHMQYERLIGDLQNGFDANRESLKDWLDYYPKNGCHQCPLCPSCGVPNTCACGRSCLPSEVDQKLKAIMELCRKTYLHNNG